MKRVLLSVVVISAVLSFIISCASGPETQETTVPEKEPAVQEEEPVQITETQKETEVKESPQPSEEAVEEPEEITQWSGINAEEEPNNGPGDANPVEFGKTFKTSIQEEGDSDWFKLQVTEQGYVQIMAKDVPDPIKLQVRYGIWDEWEEEFKVLRNWMFLPDACAVEKGVVYVQVLDEFEDDASSKPFTLRIDFIPEMDPFERNNSPDSAAEFIPGTAGKIAIFPSKDTDWFRVPIEEQGYLEVVSRGAPEGIKPQVRYGTWDEWESEFTVTRNWRFLSDACAVAQGDLYLQISDEWDDRGEPELFDIKMDFIPEMDAGEPNNSVKTATGIEPGSAVKPAIYPVGDTDWYKITVPEQGYLQVITRGAPGNIKPEVRYCTYSEWDDELTVIRNWKFTPDGCAVAEGDVYLQLIDERDDEGSTDLFDMKVDFVNEFDPGEVNNSPATATETSAGETVTLAIYPVGDTDWYKVSVPGPGNLKVSAMDVPGNMKIAVSYHTYDEWDEEVMTIRHWQLLPDSCPVEGGDVYVQLIDDREDEASMDTFKIKFEFTSN